ncbi:HelD family protein [Kineosporia succinea]|uniref:UvrD-like helicase ATP-binding domain-containing protein n=1 Tax=Kineosporia succinea TaxID=84632 RepID=A0ABT9P954_9ACTN|nr:AAA family ATPase [Kineosporia succinea]MDP9828992.1 hypothetical protein [Kineosporia succinea]
MPEVAHQTAVEQTFLDRAVARRGEILVDLDTEIAAAPADRDGQARAQVLRRRRTELRRARDGLVFGRLDALDGTVRHIGRVGLRQADDDAEPLVLDWRADAARPFYTATPLSPQGQARRRHIRTQGATVTDVSDEPLDGSSDSGLVGEGALLAALGQRRTGRMGTAISTLQREQDDIIRADASGALIVQGGPGTGKTVVALHRVAYLLFTYPQLAEQGVLVLGPSARFLEYIEQVLPALGETAVVSATCDTLLPGVVVERPESREVSEIKGRVVWQSLIEGLVASLVPEPRELRPRWEGEEFPVSAAKVAQMLTAVAGRPYHEARRVFSVQFRQIMVDAVVERREAMLTEVEEGFEDILATFRPGWDDGGPSPAVSGAEVDGQLSDGEIAELRDEIFASATVSGFLTAWWPDLSARDVLGRLLRDRALLSTVLPDDEIARVTDLPGSLAASDIPLLDAVADRLGPVTPDDPEGESVADRARRSREWVYGHVVVDEAQELSEMQWQMVLRRCPARSVTAVGDIDQAEASHRHTTWAGAVGAALGERWRPAELSICYRTPSEVMELTGPVLEKAGSSNRPPKAVRSSGVPPWSLATSPDDVAEVAARSVARLTERWAGGTVGVVAPASLMGVLPAALPGIPVMTAAEAKGLEWDATLVVDPDGISAEPRGWNGLYVALTRCTQELGQIVVTR